ncbi:Integrin alpha-L [Ophiophagus hannah]|uniref:Integrin alpha-L n=1 Tax=Ophiophagus hannah TaxID=8665 RepID=V8NXS5_OPHHA|nr:Integrin alpha-L [Ophiophagus hannah]
MGRVLIFEDNLILLGEFNGDLGYPLGRFGAAITDLADVNGDKQSDVAIGAPLEDGEKGAVYIYNSHEKTLLMEYSQRITGASISPGLRYFGQSIHGKTDLSGDGLTSIAVGALGKVMVLQSRPIVNVATRVTFEPKEIPVKDVECSGPSKPWQNINLKLRICFDNTFATESYTGHLSAKLLFRLEIDPDRVKYRGEFRNGKNILNGAKEISLKPVCVLEEINITELVVSPQHPLEMNLELVNQREDAYFTMLYVPLLPGLSFRKHSVLKFNAVVTLQCDAMLRRQDFQGLACNVSHPIYRNSTKLQFGVLSNVAWKETLEMMAYVTSENEENETLQNNRALHSIPVKYPINIIVKGLETSTQYIDFSSELQENKTVTHSYQHWAVDEYLIYKCDLGQINSSTIHVTGMMSTQNKSEHSLQTQLRTALWVEFDTRRYKNIYSHEFAQVQVTEIEVIIMMNYLPIIIGSAIGGLFLLILCIIGLYKCGFFKRNYKQKIELQGEHENAAQAADNLEDGAEKEGSKTEKENQSKLTEPLNSENDTQ